MRPRKLFGWFANFILRHADPEALWNIMTATAFTPVPDPARKPANRDEIIESLRRSGSAQYGRLFAAPQNIKATSPYGSRLHGRPCRGYDAELQDWIEGTFEGWTQQSMRDSEGKGILRQTASAIVIDHFGRVRVFHAENVSFSDMTRPDGEKTVSAA